VSLWRRDRVEVWLAPSAVVLARTRGGLFARSAPSTRQAVVADERSWEGAVAALEQEMAQAQWSGANLHVRVSDHFVRYVMLPWRDGLRNLAEWTVYAERELDDRFGSGGQLEIRIAAQRAGQPRLAAAIDTELVEALRALATRCRSRLAAIETNLCRAGNRARRAIVKTDAVIAVSEPGRLSLLAARQDRWTEVVSVRSGSEPSAALRASIAQMRLAAAAPIERLLLWGEFAGESDMHAIAPKAIRLAPPRDLPRACLALGMI